MQRSVACLSTPQQEVSGTVSRVGKPKRLLACGGLSVAKEFRLLDHPVSVGSTLCLPCHQLSRLLGVDNVGSTSPHTSWQERGNEPENFIRLSKSDFGKLFNKG